MDLTFMVSKLSVIAYSTAPVPVLTATTDPPADTQTTSHPELMKKQHLMRYSWQAQTSYSTIRLLLSLGKLSFVLLVFGMHNFLHTGRIQHDANLSSNRLRRQIPSETAPHNTIGSMGPGNLAPSDSEFVSSFISSLCLGDKGDLLAQVEISVFLAVDTLNFDQTDTVVLGPKTTLVAKDGSVHM
jgi:hypothetical protein